MGFAERLSVYFIIHNDFLSIYDQNLWIFKGKINVFAIDFI